MDVRSVAVPLSAALLSGLLAACGSGDDAIRTSTADDLHSQVAAVRDAVVDRRNPAALAAVADLKTTIRRLVEAGDLNSDDGAVLLKQVDGIKGRIDDRAVPTPTPVPTPAPVSESGNGDGDNDDDGSGNGKNKNKGKGDD